jgi:hypothetical protein
MIRLSRPEPSDVRGAPSVSDADAGVAVVGPTAAPTGSRSTGAREPVAVVSLAAE